MLKILDTIGIYSLSALPASGTAGEVAYYNGSFYGWTGSAWKSLNNDATTKFDVGLGNVNNTSDLAKPISTATQSALDLKVSQGLLSLSGLTSSAAARVVGRRSDSAGALEELSVGAGVTMRGTVIGLADIASGTFVGNSSASTGAPQALSKATATSLINEFTVTLKGLVPAPGTSSGRYLKDDGTWSTVVATNSASSTSFTPTGNLSSTDVQSALAELDSEKSAVGHNHTGVYQPLNGFLNSFIDAVSNGEPGYVKLDENGDIITETINIFVGASSTANGGVGLVPAPLANDQSKFLRGDGTWQTVVTAQTAGGTAFTPYGNLVSTDVQSAIQELDDEKAKTGPIISSGLSVASNRFLGRSSANTGAIEELDATTATLMLNTFTTSLKGLVPPPGSRKLGSYFLRSDGTWVNPVQDFDPVFDTGTGLAQNIELPISGLLPHQVLVFVNGLRFRSTEYSISGTTLTVTTNAPGDDIEILRR